MLGGARLPEKPVFSKCFCGTLAAPKSATFTDGTQRQELEKMSLLLRSARVRGSVAEVIERCRDTRNETRLLLRLLDEILAESRAAAICARHAAFPVIAAREKYYGRR